MDKETSLLTAQTIMKGIGEIMGGAAEGFKAAKGLKTPVGPAPVQGFRR